MNHGLGKDYVAYCMKRGLPEIKYKVCRVCNLPQPESRFYQKTGGKSLSRVRRAVCADCCKKQDKRRRDARKVAMAGG